MGALSWGKLQVDRDPGTYGRTACRGSFWISAGREQPNHNQLDPLVAALMELAWKLHAANVNLDLYWLPRLQNSEADALTNCFVQWGNLSPNARFRGRPLRGHQRCQEEET